MGSSEYWSESTTVLSKDTWNRNWGNFPHWGYSLALIWSFKNVRFPNVLNQLYDSILRTVLWSQPASLISCSSVSLSGLLLSWPENSIWFLAKTLKPPASTVRHGPFLKPCLDGEKLYVKGSRHDKGLMELRFIALSLSLVWFDFFLLKSNQAAPMSAPPCPHITGLACGWTTDPGSLP